MQKLMVIICLLFFSSICWADARVLTWDDCVKESQQNHPDLVSAREKINQAKASKSLTKSGVLPQLTGSASEDISKIQKKDSTKSYAYGVSARQLLFDGFKTSNDLREASENIKSAEYNYKVVSSNVRLSLWSAFYNLLSAQELLKVTQSILKRRQQNLSLVNLQYQSGMEHKGSLLTAQANEAQAQLDFVQAQRSLELAQRSLSKALGRATFEPMGIKGELHVDPVDTQEPDFEVMVEETPLLKELTAQKEAAKFGLKSAKSSFFPQVYADGSLGKSGDAWSPQTKSWSAGVSVSFPIFQGGSQQASFTKAKAVLSQAKADEQSGRNDVIYTLAQTWIEWQNSADQVAVQEKFLAASFLRADIVEAQYKSGLASFNDWTTIEDNLVRDQKALLQSKIAAKTAEASWLQAKGVTLDE